METLHFKRVPENRRQKRSCFKRLPPLFDEKGGVVGILASTQRTARLKNIIERVPLGSGIDVAVIDGDGNLVYSSRISCDKRIVPYPFHDSLRRTIDGNNSRISVSDSVIDGRTRHITFAVVPDIGWTVLVERDVATIFRSEGAHLVQLAVISALIFLLVAVLLVYLRKQSLTRQTEQRLEAAEALRESEEKYSSLFEQSQDAILLTVPDGFILEANRAACEMFGRSAEDIRKIGRAGLVNQDDPRLQPALDERKRMGKAAAEITMVRADGEIFPAEVTSALFTDMDGRQKASMIIRDIMERKKAEERIFRQARLLRSINAVFQETFTESGQAGVARICLRLALEMTERASGFPTAILP